MKIVIKLETEKVSVLSWPIEHQKKKKHHSYFVLNGEENDGWKLNIEP